MNLGIQVDVTVQTRYFILSSIIIDEFKWRLLLNDYLQFRKYLRVSKGLKLEEEIHQNKKERLNTVPEESY